MAAFAVLLCVLGMVGCTQGESLPSEPQSPTQGNFSIERWMGKWYGVAMAWTCPFWKRTRGDTAVPTVSLNWTSNDTFNCTSTQPRAGVCKQYSYEYQLTQTPGRFHYYYPEWDADVDVYVLATDYDHYALLLRLEHKRNSDKRGASVTLYGRSPEVQPSALEQFTSAAADQGLDEESTGYMKNTGECFMEEEPEPASASVASPAAQV
ncbi:protein AMBP-like [Engraulis encrasicolus]|uniref:protein AMBP-like n=1 Tax=Engraulis encrasicolus TaxID=184585 RepID=UPI002FD23F8A